MYGAEVYEGETARFEVELSEDDVHGQWKLNGEVLSPSAVCPVKIHPSRNSPNCGLVRFHFLSTAMWAMLKVPYNIIFFG